MAIRKTPRRSITKNTLIMDAIDKHPETLNIFLKHNMHCVGCHAAKFESIEAGARAHGKKSAEIDKLIKELNTLIRKEKKRK